MSNKAFFIQTLLSNFRYTLYHFDHEKFKLLPWSCSGQSFDHPSPEEGQIFKNSVVTFIPPPKLLQIS